MIKKLMTIADRDSLEADALPDIIRTSKIYKLSEAISVSHNDSQMPELFKDINSNGEMCGCPELSMSRIVTIVESLYNIQNEFKEYCDQFSHGTMEYEARAKAVLQELEMMQSENAVHKDEIFKVISFCFKNQDGEAVIKLKQSIPYKPSAIPAVSKPSNHVSPLMPAVPHDDEYANIED